MDDLASKSPANIKFLGNVSDSELAKLYSGAKALIWSSLNEDFGMVPAEAMGRGVPVVAYKDDSGATETIVENKTGLFFTKYNTESLFKALKKVDKIKIKSSDCIKRAELYSEKSFRNKFTGLISTYIKNEK
jgi:glycosyltransferase involved in cell wall biosynthesis